MFQAMKLTIYNEARFWTLNPIPYYSKVWLFKTNHLEGLSPCSEYQRIPSGVTLRLVIKGEWRIDMRGKAHKAQPGDIFCAMPSEPLRFTLLDSPERWEWYELQFQGPEAERFLGEFGLGPGNPCATPRNPKKALRLFKLIHASMLDEGRSELGMLSALFALAKACGGPLRQSQRLNWRKELVRKMKMLQESAPFVNTNIGEVAELLGVNRCTLYKAFKAETGISPHEYIDRLRFSRSMELVKGTRLPLASIAAQTGFSDVKYFIVWFKEKTGATPGSFRPKKAPER